MSSFSIDSFSALHQTAVARLLSSLHPDGDHWEGELAESALATAVAVFALQKQSATCYYNIIQQGLNWLANHQNTDGGFGDTPNCPSNLSTTLLVWAIFEYITTENSTKNLPITQIAVNPKQRIEQWIQHEIASLEPAKIASAVLWYYGEDRTFAAPILATLAMANKIPWALVPQLPLELAIFPRWLWRILHLQVVSYAIPALVAIGRVKHQFAPGNFLIRFLRTMLMPQLMNLLQYLQPSSGGYLEAIPLTAFVVMSLCHCQENDHQISQNGANFLAKTQRSNGSWAIDINLSVWLTSLAVKALIPTPPILKHMQTSNQAMPKQTTADTSGPSTTSASQPLNSGADTAGPSTTSASQPINSGADTAGPINSGADTAGPINSGADTAGPSTTSAGQPTNSDQTNQPNTSHNTSEPLTIAQQEAIANWLLAQQTRERHIFTDAQAGAWGWTHHTGSVPDADDTSAALLALLRLGKLTPDKIEAAKKGICWLLDLQNRDGGIPTFCKGWGRLPFDQSCSDISAHALQAFWEWLPFLHDPTLQLRVQKAMLRIVFYLGEQVGNEEFWLPRWFGDPQTKNCLNPIYGTSQVVLSLVACDNPSSPTPTAFILQPSAEQELVQALMLSKGVQWLLACQNRDGGWGTNAKSPSVLETTALVLACLSDMVANIKDISPDKSPTNKDNPIYLVWKNLTKTIKQGVSCLDLITQHGKSFPAHPIGLYFANLWYSEQLYPVIFTVMALQKISQWSNQK